VNQRSAEGNQLIISYLSLRKFVGWVGTLLPVILPVGVAICSQPQPGSVSGYYYTDLRNVFVGALCALGVFLWAYDGYDDVDRWITNIAGLCAIGVAFCPTKPTVCTAGARACPASTVPVLSTSQQVVGDVHVFFAMATFIMLGLMALRFAKRGETPSGLSVLNRIRYGLGFGGSGDGLSSRRHHGETLIYHATGITILSCVILAVASNLLPASVNAQWRTLFIVEAVAVFSFGISWFAKGRTLDAVLARLRSRAVNVDGEHGAVRPDLVH
jgi:hypothetical protein